MAFETIRTEKMYHGKAFDVRRDQVKLADDCTVQLDIVEHAGAVTIIPIDQHGRVWFVRQYRHAAVRQLLELPAGTLEPGEAPEVCARRELQEEIGMSAEQIEKVGEFFLAPGYSTEYMFMFMARGLYSDPLPGDEDEFISIEKIPLENIRALVKTGYIQDAKTLAGLFLLPLP